MLQSEQPLKGMLTHKDSSLASKQRAIATKCMNTLKEEEALQLNKFGGFT